MLQKLCCSPPAQPWVGEQCLEQFVPNRYPILSESREKKARRYRRYIGIHWCSFSMLVIHTDLFAQLKVMGLFNVHRLAVIRIVILIANFYL